MRILDSGWAGKTACIEKHKLINFFKVYRKPNKLIRGKANSQGSLQKTCKHKNLLTRNWLSTENRPIYILETGAPIIVCPAKKFAKQYFPLNSFIEIGSCFFCHRYLSFYLRSCWKDWAGPPLLFGARDRELTGSTVIGSVNLCIKPSCCVMNRKEKRYVCWDSNSVRSRSFLC